jgi:hypothetical protein
MSGKKGNIIELFVDKAVLAVAGLIALGILFIYVIGNPSAVEYAGQKLGPKDIDNYINKDAQRLREKLRQEPNTASQYESQKPQYLSLLKDPIEQTVNTDIRFPLPGYIGTTVDKDRTYRIPQPPLIDKPSVAVVRMAAFVPTEELTSATPYENSETKLEDVDLVTIESAVNAKQLYDGFRESFAARSLPERWRSEQYAKPVFAKVELQRKTQQSDGSWSDWIEMPRTKICSKKKELRVPQKADEYGMEISLVQFAKPEFRDEILQPPVYYNAIPIEPWISPSFYNERQKTIAKQKEDARRLEIEAERARRLQERATQPNRQPTTRQPIRGGGDTSVPDEGGPSPSRTQPKRPGRDTTIPDRTQSLSEESKFNVIRLGPDTNPAELEKLVFWAHDDTTVSGEKYQYRIRIGVLNPIAGKGWVSQDQNDLRDQVVLWSKFAEVNDVIEIPKRLVFFATDLREIQKSTSVDRTAEIMVAKYTLGNWVSRTFSVKNGEEIGKPVETAGDLRFAKIGISGDTIDFSTEAVMVDVQKVTEWIGAGYLRSREYSELLYSNDGKTIERMAIKERFWPAKVTKTYKEISDALAAVPVVLLDWNQAVTGSGQKTYQRSTPSQEFMPPAGTDQRQPRRGGPPTLNEGE